MKFISDGYAFYPFKKRGMVFFPSVFDTPHKISKFGVFTFVFHPNEMKKEDFDSLEKFINENPSSFNVDIFALAEKYKNRRRNVLDLSLQAAIYVFRSIKGTKR